LKYGIQIHTHNHLTALFRDYLGEPVKKETFTLDVVVCASLNESAATRRVFFTGGGGTPTSGVSASKMAAAVTIGNVSEQKIQDFQPSLR